MKSTLSLAALVLMVLLSSAPPANAGLIDWMQEWSGPGPFHWGGSVLVTRCPGPFQINNQREQNKPCFFVDTRRFIAIDGDNFPVKVTSFFADVGVTYRLRRAVSVGLGAGFMTADGNETATRPTITAPRVVFEPAVLLAQLFGKPEQAFTGNSTFWDRLVHVPKIYMRGNFILGRLNGADLGVSGTSYDRTNEYVISRGLLLDLGELIFKQ